MYSVLVRPCQGFKIMDYLGVLEKRYSLFMLNFPGLLIIEDIDYRFFLDYRVYNKRLTLVAGLVLMTTFSV